MVRKKARRKPRQEEDPMAGTTNLTDAMLVLALGFLIFAVVGWNLQSVVFSDMTQEEKQDVMESITNITNVTQGEKLNLQILPTSLAKVMLNKERSTRILKPVI